MLDWQEAGRAGKQAETSALKHGECLVSSKANSNRVEATLSAGAAAGQRGCFIRSRFSSLEVDRANGSLGSDIFKFNNGRP